MRNTTSIAGIVDFLRQLLGAGVLLISWPLSSKGTKKKWSHITAAHMADRKYLKSLATGNIGVIQGDPSGGIASLDIDCDGDDEEFLALNPELRETLRSRGARGSNVWFYPEGEVPPSCKLKRNGQAWGEWRHNGCQTIVAGMHPDGHPYTLLCDKPPIRYAFSKLKFPSGVTAPFLSSPVFKETEPNRTEPQTVVSVPSVPSVPSVSGNGGIAKDVIESLLKGTIPGATHTNHEKLFTFARRVKAYELRRQKPIDAPEMREIFSYWYERAKGCLRSELSWEEYFFEFMEGYGDVKQPAGCDIVDIAWRAANAAPPPAEALTLADPQLQKLVSLCRILAALSQPEPFFIACRTVQRLFELASHERAARWLRMLQAKGFIEEVIKGGPDSMKATRYYYRGNPQPPTA